MTSNGNTGMTTRKSMMTSNERGNNEHEERRGRDDKKLHE